MDASCIFLGQIAAGHLRKSERNLVSSSVSEAAFANPLAHLSAKFTNASINIVTDIFTGVLPLPVLKSLNLPKRQRYVLMAVFALGGLYVTPKEISVDITSADLS